MEYWYCCYILFYFWICFIDDEIHCLLVFLCYCFVLILNYPPQTNKLPTRKIWQLKNQWNTYLPIIFFKLSLVILIFKLSLLKITFIYKLFYGYFHNILFLISQFLVVKNIINYTEKINKKTYGYEKSASHVKSLDKVLKKRVCFLYFSLISNLLCLCTEISVVYVLTAFYIS